MLLWDLRAGLAGHIDRRWLLCTCQRRPPWRILRLRPLMRIPSGPDIWAENEETFWSEQLDGGISSEPDASDGEIYGDGFHIEAQQYAKWVVDGKGNLVLDFRDSAAEGYVLATNIPPPPIATKGKSAGTSSNGSSK